MRRSNHPNGRVSSQSFRSHATGLLVSPRIEQIPQRVPSTSARVTIYIASLFGLPDLAMSCVTSLCGSGLLTAVFPLLNKCPNLIQSWGSTATPAPGIQPYLFTWLEWWSGNMHICKYISKGEDMRENPYCSSAHHSRVSEDSNFFSVPCRKHGPIDGPAKSSAIERMLCM